MKENMKLYELTLNAGGLRFRHANPHPLSAQQKYYIAMTFIGCVTMTAVVLAFFSLLK